MKKRLLSKCIHAQDKSISMNNKTVSYISQTNIIYCQVLQKYDKMQVI